MASVLAVPNLEVIKSTFGGQLDTERPLFVFYNSIAIRLFFKFEFGQLDITQGDRPQILRLEPEFLHFGLNTYFLVFRIQFIHNSFPQFTFILGINVSARN